MDLKSPEKHIETTMSNNKNTLIVSIFEFKVFDLVTSFFLESEKSLAIKTTADIDWAGWANGKYCHRNHKLKYHK